MFVNMRCRVHSLYTLRGRGFDTRHLCIHCYIFHLDSNFLLQRGVSLMLLFVTSSEFFTV